MVERVKKKSKMGRPSLFKPEYSKEVERLCKLGVTDKDIALFFNVSIDAVQNWQRQFPEFFYAVARGKQQADNNVAAALYKNAMGFHYIEDFPVRVKKELRDADGNVTGTQEYVKVVPMKKYAKPDTTAQIFFLKNRRPDEFRDKKHVEDDTPVERKVFRGILELKKAGFVQLDGEYTLIENTKP